MPLCSAWRLHPKAEGRPRVFIKSVCIGHSSLSQTCSPTENTGKSWERGGVACGLLCSPANLPVPLGGTHTRTKRSVLWHVRPPKMALFLTNSERQAFSKRALLVGSSPAPHAPPPPRHPPITNTPMMQRMSYSQMLTGETPSPLSLMGRRGEKEVTIASRSFWAFKMTFL